MKFNWKNIEIKSMAQNFKEKMYEYKREMMQWQNSKIVFKRSQNIKIGKHQAIQVVNERFIL